MVTYEQVMNVTHQMGFYFPILAITFLFFLIWGSLGFMRKRVRGIYSRRFGSSMNYWIMTFIILITLSVFAYFIFLPIHLKLIG